MTTVNELWFKSSQANQQAEQAYHRLLDRYNPSIELETDTIVSRRRFQVLLDRLRACGAPYGAHTIVYRPDRSILLVRHEGVDQWVLPGGEIVGNENFREAAERELREEAGIIADYEGLAILSRVTIKTNGYDTWGVIPTFAASARSVVTKINDPDGEISAAKWFNDLPVDTRDREQLRTWREQQYDH